MRRLFPALLACTLAAVVAVPGPAAAEDVPADRRSLGAPPDVRPADADPLILPPAPEPASDIGRRDWATVDADTLRRERHLRNTAAAFGFAGSLAGLGVTCLLVAPNQPTEAHRRGWLTAAGVLGGMSGAALVTGTVLWATTPPAPGRPRFAVGPEGATLTMRF